MKIKELFLNTGGSVKYQILKWNEYICVEEGIIDDFNFESSPFNDIEIAHISVWNNKLIICID